MWPAFKALSMFNPRQTVLVSEDGRFLSQQYFTLINLPQVSDGIQRSLNTELRPAYKVLWLPLLAAHGPLPVRRSRYF